MAATTKKAAKAAPTREAREATGKAGATTRTRTRPGGMEGTVWDEAAYAAAGYRRINLRLARVPAAQLADLEKALGLEATEVCRRAIEELHKTVVTSKRGKRSGDAD